MTLCGALFMARSSLGAAAAQQPQRSSPADPLDVSMLQLIARPADFDGQYVRVYGFYNHEFEGHALYLHREDFEQMLSRNGVWMEGKAADDEKYILVEGRFNAGQHGHLGLFSGAIESVTRTLAWPPAEAMRARQRVQANTGR